MLVAEDALSDEEIAGKVGISRRTLTNWKRDPAFQERVTEMVAQFAEQAASHAIADLDHRIRRYQARADALDGIVAERAADPTMQEVPGGRSGYLVRQLKSIMVTYEPEPNQDGEIEPGARATMVRQQLAEYAVDTGLLKELRELDKQAAIESGQWAEKREITGASGAPLTIQIIERSDGPQ